MRFSFHSLSLTSSAVRRNWRHARASDTAASLTLSAIFALFPFLIFLIATTSLFLNPFDATLLVEQLDRFAPVEVTQILSRQITVLVQNKHIDLITFGGATAFLSVMQGNLNLMRALNYMHHKRDQRSLRRRMALASIAACAYAILGGLAMMLLASTSELSHGLSCLNIAPAFMQWLQVSTVVTLLWAALYRYLPDGGRAHRVWPGALVAGSLWLIASMIFSRYVTDFGTFNSVYGALGGVMVLLLWLWISSQVLLLGAVINVVLGRT